MATQTHLQPPLCNSHLTETTGKYCRSCKSLVCSLCLMSGKHNSHNIISYEDFFTKQQRKVRKQLEQVQQIEQPTVELQKKLESIKSQTRKEYEENTQRVSTFMTNVNAGIDAWGDEKIKLLKEKKTLQLKRLKSTLTKIQSIEIESDINSMEEKVELAADTAYCLTEEPQLDIEQSKIRDTVRQFMPKGFQVPTSTLDSNEEEECSSFEEFMRAPLASSVSQSKITSSLPAPATAFDPQPNPHSHSRTSSFGAVSFFSCTTVDGTAISRTTSYTTSLAIKPQGPPSELHQPIESAAAILAPPREIPLYSVEPMAVIRDSTLKTSLQDKVSIGDICTNNNGDVIISDPTGKCIRVIMFSELPTNYRVTLTKCGTHEPSVVSFNGSSKRIVFVDRHSGSLRDLKPGGSIQKLACSDIVPGGITTGLSIDGKLRTFVTNLKDSSIVVLNSQGKIKRKIELAPLNIQPLSISFCPISLAVIVTDLKQRCLHKITLRGEECWSAGQPARQEGITEHPSGVAVLPNEAIAVADKKKHCITVFASNGDLLSHIGGPDAGPERTSFHAPTGITYCLKRNSLLVVDGENKRIKVLSLQSSVVKQAIGL